MPLSNPLHLLWSTHFSPRLNDEVESLFVSLSEYRLLPLRRVLPVLEEGSRGVDLDHVNAFKIVQLPLAVLPLSHHIVERDIVPDIVEVTAEGAA